MKKRLLLSAALLAFACASRAAGQEAAWSRYTYAGEEFSVELPGTPLVYNTDRLVNGNLRKPNYEKVRVFDLYSGGVIFFVAAYDRPHPEESFDFFAAELRGAWGLVAKGDLKLGGFEGRSYEAVGTQRGRKFYDVHGEARVFRAKSHAYLLLALSTEPNRPEVRRFLDSVTLGPAPAGEQVAAEAPVPRYVAPKKQEGPPPEAVPNLVRGPDDPYEMKELEHKAVIVYKPEPPYTEEARKRNVTGVIRVRAVLSPTGEVVRPEVLKSLPSGLTESALRVTRHMRFFPAEKDGRPVPQYVVLEFNFNIY
ncbi:MAG: energy transducer TonB [Acidobacteria bacterium]|nr:energy transducer TonB [Acidobacteriota bacterium]